jgi:hypothetical protein
VTDTANGEPEDIEPTPRPEPEREPSHGDSTPE